MKDELKKKVRDMVEGGKSYLANNDLVGFYDYLHNNYCNFPNCFDICKVTEFLENCGIDTVNNLEYSIPDYYATLIDAPKSLITTDGDFEGNVLHFPDNIEVLDEGAFGQSKNFSVIDLRGIRQVGLQVFYETNADTVIVDETLEYVDATAFQHTNIDTIVMRNGMDMEKTISLFRACWPVDVWNNMVYVTKDF